ncbi:MAG: glycoside hydrolase family 57 protein [Spirochaetia bacterium]|jgi:alpha-amylase|nr:glycoside hydrolase family 57 protein [Spirochaetia bacterium]
MKSICIYFQIHQPLRLKTGYNFFSIGSDHFYEDDDLNRKICNKVSRNCYIPSCRLIYRLISKYRGKFRVSFSITGIALEQLRRYNPEVIELLKKLSGTGCVEFLSETYYHSLAFLYSRQEFIAQAEKHRKTISQLFGAEPVTFRNTELIYNNDIASAAAKLGFKNILAEGAESVLGWRSPDYLYTAACHEDYAGNEDITSHAAPEVLDGFTGKPLLNLLLKNYRLSDDIAFRYSDKNWKEYPLSAEKYINWVKAALLNRELINLFMDFETFGEHQWKETGIFSFFEDFVSSIIQNSDIDFILPKEAAGRHKSSGIIDVPHYTSWADKERNLSAWTGNALQRSALKMIYRLEKDVKLCGSEELLDTWRKLGTSDHFYYMSTKYFSDGEIHKYFNYFYSPYDAFIIYSNIVNDLHETIKKRMPDENTEKSCVFPSGTVKIPQPIMDAL